MYENFNDLTAAAEIRKSVSKSTFDLKNKFCDAEKLKNSRNNAHIPHKLIYFFSHLFNVPHSYLCNYQINTNDIEDDNDGPDFYKKESNEDVRLQLVESLVIVQHVHC